MKARLFTETGVQKQEFDPSDFAIYSPFYWFSWESLSTLECKLFRFRDYFLAFSVDRAETVS